jgi:ABC-type bacteriocin/lantibiotic exporter with double-glycine peptidase domain
MPQYVYQTNSYECGTRAIQNAFIALGYDHIERNDIKIIAGTNRYIGTTKRGIVRAVKFHGFVPTVYQTQNKELAWRWALRNAMKYPCIVLVDNRGHWSTLSGVFGKKVTLIDPSDMRDGAMGAYALSKEELLERWGDVRGVYYAIRIKPK